MLQLSFVIPKGGISVDWFASEQYLNGDVVQEYLYGVYRETSPHLTKSVLQKIPVPPGYFLGLLEPFSSCQFVTSEW